jgi:predicted GIY-YIG superfamily endonuclease
MRPPKPPIATGEVPFSRYGATSYVYRAYDRDDELLYVGVTDDLFSRMHQHKLSAAWWTQAERIVWEQYENRIEAERAERYSIMELLPQHNRRDNHRRILAAEMGHRRPHDGEAWRRLGNVIRAERTTMRRTQTSIAGDAHVDVTDFRCLERGEAVKYERWFLERVEIALGWHGGSIEAVLGGGEPSRLNEEELSDRARAAARLVSLGDRI